MSGIFLSHSSKDKEFVTRLANDLNSFDIPVWFDDRELKVGDSLNKLIEKRITGSNWFAIIISKNSINSPWVEKEVTAGLTIELEKKQVYVLPILIEDCEVPLFLRDKVYADFRIDYETGLHTLLKRLNPEITKEYDYKVSKHILDYYPKFPLVEPYDVPRILIETFSKAIDPTDATLWISETNAFRRSANPGDDTARFIQLHTLPSAENNPFNFWIKVFDQARKIGPKVLAALLITVPDDNFSQQAKDAKSHLLEKLKNYK